MPTYVLLSASRITGEKLLPTDIGYSQGLVLLVALAALSDQQQWSRSFDSTLVVQLRLIIFRLLQCEGGIQEIWQSPTQV